MHPDHGRHHTAGPYAHEQETPPMNEPTKSTPEPVLRAAGLYGTATALVVTAVGVLVAVGWLSQAEADAVTTAIDTLGSQIVPIGVAVTGVTGVVSAVVSNLVTAFAARRHTVPVDSDAFDVVPKRGV